MDEAREVAWHRLTSSEPESVTAARTLSTAGKTVPNKVTDGGEKMTLDSPRGKIQGNRAPPPKYAACSKAVA